MRILVILTVLLVISIGGAAIGESIGEPIGESIGTEANVIINYNSGGSGSQTAGSHEDPPLFIPAEPLKLLTGWCCGTGPHNVSTVEHYVKSFSMYTSISKAAILSRVTFTCPGILYPNRKTEAECYIYTQRYYFQTKLITKNYHRTVTREYACKDDVHVCCPDYISYRDSCVTQSECDRQNKMRERQGLPADCGV